MAKNAQENQTKSDKTEYSKVLEAVKQKALRRDPIYMQSHKEEAIAENLTGNEEIDMPPRTPDKFVRIYIMPYTNQNGIYIAGQTQIFKYKEGHFVLSADVPEDDSANINYNSSFEKADK
jgi:hypothetical protein